MKVCNYLQQGTSENEIFLLSKITGRGTGTAPRLQNNYVVEGEEDSSSVAPCTQ